MRIEQSKLKNIIRQATNRVKSLTSVEKARILNGVRNCIIYAALSTTIAENVVLKKLTYCRTFLELIAHLSTIFE